MDDFRSIASEASRSSESIFGDNAQRMAAAGLAVIPLAPDRQPFVAQFNKWSRAPGARTVAKWAESHPTANIGIIPGLSNLWVADADSRDEVSEVEDLLGETGLRVKTNRGAHLYYAKPCERFPSSLRKFGLNVDLKAGNSIVIAPPSRHESGARYQIEKGDWSALKDLPRPNTERLRKLLSGQQVSLAPHRADNLPMRDNSRGLALNDRLCAHAWAVDTFEELLDVAQTLNAKFPEPLDSDEVVWRTRDVWKDLEGGKLERRVGRPSRGRTERKKLFQLDTKLGGDAYALLEELKDSHAARCRRGETFSITPKAMASKQVIPGWGRTRYEKNRDLLLKAGCIEKVSSFKNGTKGKDGRVGAQYKLTS
jgi:hypothetical protein